MGIGATKIWTWTLVVAMTVQLLLAGSHIHSPHRANIGHAVSAGEADCHLAATELINSSNVCADDNVTSREFGHSPGAPGHEPHKTFEAQKHSDANDNHDDHNNRGIDCDLCWILSLLAGLVLTILALCILVNSLSQSLLFVRAMQLVASPANDLYRARAPPLLIAS